MAELLFIRTEDILGKCSEIIIKTFLGFRNGELVKESLEKTIRMNEGKHRNAKLEKEIEKMSLNQHGSTGYGGNRKHGPSGSSPKNNTDPSKDILELQTK